MCFQFERDSRQERHLSGTDCSRRARAGESRGAQCQPYPSDLNQVFLILLVNAAHAIGDLKRPPGERGTITISTRREGDSEIVVAIADTGIGMPEALRTKIFDAFFTTKGIGRRTGQGLAIARMIVVEKHQGSLTFDTKVGESTTLYVKLPIATTKH